MQAAKSCPSTHQKATPNLKPNSKSEETFKGQDKRKSAPCIVLKHLIILKRSHRALQSQRNNIFWTYSFYSYVMIKNT